MRVGALLGWVAACQCIMTPTVSPLNAPTGSPTMSPWTMDAPTGSPMTAATEPPTAADPLVQACESRAAGSWIDMKSWVPVSNSPTRWDLQDGGRTVEQRMNNPDPAFLVSDEDIIDVVIKGTLSVVETFNPDGSKVGIDNDLIGLTMGMQHPFSGGDLETYDAMMFSWGGKRGGNDPAFHDFLMIQKLNGTIKRGQQGHCGGDQGACFWYRTDGQGIPGKEIGSTWAVNNGRATCSQCCVNPGWNVGCGADTYYCSGVARAESGCYYGDAAQTAGWAMNTEYELGVLFSEDLFRISIDGVVMLNVSQADMLAKCTAPFITTNSGQGYAGCVGDTKKAWRKGRMAWYALSQGGVRYSDMRMFHLQAGQPNDPVVGPDYYGVIRTPEPTPPNPLRKDAFEVVHKSTRYGLLANDWSPTLSPIRVVVAPTWGQDPQTDLGRNGIMNVTCEHGSTLEVRSDGAFTYYPASDLAEKIEQQLPQERCEYRVVDETSGVMSHKTDITFALQPPQSLCDPVWGPCFNITWDAYTLAKHSDAGYSCFGEVSAVGGCGAITDWALDDGYAGRYTLRGSGGNVICAKDSLLEKEASIFLTRTFNKMLVKATDVFGRTQTAWVTVALPATCELIPNQCICNAMQCTCLPGFTGPLCGSKTERPTQSPTQTLPLKNSPSASPSPPSVVVTEPPTAAATEPPTAAATEPPTNSTFSGCDPARPDVCMLKGNDMPSRYRCYDASTGDCLAKSAEECIQRQGMVYCRDICSSPDKVTCVQEQYTNEVGATETCYWLSYAGKCGRQPCTSDFEDGCRADPYICEWDDKVGCKIQTCRPEYTQQWCEDRAECKYSTKLQQCVHKHCWVPSEFKCELYNFKCDWEGGVCKTKPCVDHETEGICHEDDQCEWSIEHSPGYCTIKKSPVTDPPTATPPSPARPPAYCSARDWGGCSPTKCCASANFECVKMNRWYGQCRPLGDCPKGWRCNKVKSMTRGEACGCEGYRGDGVTSSSPVLCKLHKAVDGKRYCDAPSSLGECEARTYSACGERVRWRVLVKAAKSDIFGGNLSKALTTAMRIEARQLVMEWICPDALCQPECPTTKQLKTLRGCLKMVNDGQIRSRTASGLSEEKAEKFFVTGTLSEDVTREFEEEKMSELGRQIDLISGGMAYDDAADDLAAFIVRGGESVLEVSAEPIEDSPFGMGTEAGGSSDGGDGSVPLGAVIGSIVGALALCAGVGVFLTRRRAQKSSFEGLRGSTERDDIVDMQSLASAYTSKLPDSGKARSGLSEL